MTNRRKTGDKPQNITNMEIEILRSCFDEMAIFPYLTTTPEKLGALQIIVDALELYPNQPTSIRNALASAQRGISGELTPSNAIEQIRTNIEGLLSEITEQISRVTPSTFLLITYHDSDDKAYSDLLAASELSIPPEWLTRIVTVEALTEPPRRYIGLEAIDFLRSINAVQESEQ